MMAHRVSPFGIVGMGALGQALEKFVASHHASSPAAILFAVKAFDLEQALIEQTDRWPASIPFVVLSNGYIWPIVEHLKPRIGARPVRIGMTTIGSTIKIDGSLEIFSENTMTAWGNWEMNSSAPSPSELALLQTFPNGQWHDDIRPLIRQKWIFNVVINTLGGAYKLANNGLVASHKMEAEALLLEACALADILWKDLPPITAIDSLRENLWSLVRATSGNENSMAKDVRLGRRSESDYLAGIAMSFDGFPLMQKLHQVIVGF